MEVCGLNLSAEIKIKTLIEVLLGMAPKFAWGKKKKKKFKSWAYAYSEISCYNSKFTNQVKFVLI